MKLLLVVLWTILGSSTFFVENVPTFVKWLDETRYLSCENNSKNSPSQGTTIIIFETLTNRSYIIEIPTNNCECEKIAESGSKTYYLIPCDSIKQYRYSSLSKYYTYNPINDELNLIKLKEVKGYDDWRIQYASWIGKNDSLIAIMDNDIYYVESIETYTSGKSLERITYDGSDLIYNGIPDWIYEEEIINDDHMYWGSTDGNLLLYSRIDNTNVPQITVPTQDQSNGESGKKVPYPHPGENCPTVQMFVIHLKNKMRWKLKPPHDMTKSEGLIFYSAKWVLSQDEVCLTWGNRYQNHLFHIYYFFTRGDISDDNSSIENEPILKAGFEMYEYRIKDGWVDEIMRKRVLIDAKGHFAYFAAPLFSPIYELSIDADPVESPVEHKNSYMRIYQSDLTHIFMEVDLMLSILGDWEVTQLICVNDKYLYFLSNQKSPFTQNLYYIDKDIDLNTNDNSTGKRPGSVYYSLMKNQRTHCITCNLGEDEMCKYALVTPNEACSKIFITCTNENGADVEALYSYNQIDGHITSIYSSNIRSLLRGRTFDDNDNKSNKVEKNLTKNCFLIHNNNYKGIKVCETSRGSSSTISPNTDNKGDLRPLLIHVYDGPESSTVNLLPPNILTEKFLDDLSNVISIEIDGSGTYGRGSKNRFRVYKNLGFYESNDIADVIKYYIKNKDVDKNKICIWGWSYGGFMSLTTVSRHPDVINCALAVAPVTDWYFYDSYYTEKYMGSITENAINYQTTSIVQNVKNLTGSHLFIAHGLNDDNVSPVNTVILLDLLKKEKIDVSYFLMSGQNHHVQNRTVYQRLYENMVKFLKERFQEM